MVLVDCIKIISEGNQSPKYDEAIKMLLGSERHWKEKFSLDQICIIASAISNYMAKQGKIYEILTLFGATDKPCGGV